MASFRKGLNKKYHIKKEDGLWYHYLGVASWINHNHMVFIAEHSGDRGLLRIPATDIRCFWVSDAETGELIENHGIDLVGLCRVYLDFYDVDSLVVYLARKVHIADEAITIERRGQAPLEIPRSLLNDFHFIEYYENTGVRS